MKPVHRPITPPQIGIPSPSTQPFGTITLDHITGLPMSNGYDAILVMVDHDISQGGVFILCKTTDTALDTAQHLLTHMFKRFGLPDRIISDRGPLFTAKTMKAVTEQLQIKWSYSTAYHP